MRWISCPGEDARLHLALEEYLLERAGGEEFFLLWRSSPSIVIGKNQNAYQEVDVLCAQRMAVPVVRRISGGGTVYHDAGNINFSFVRNAGKEFFGYETFVQPVADALRRLGLDAHMENGSDLFLPQGKISGNAQVYRRGRMIHHGTLLFEADLSALGRLLFFPEGDISSRAVRSRRSGVANIRPCLADQCGVDEFSQRLVRTLFPQGLSQYTLSEADWAAVEALADSRYGTWAWNFGLSPAFTRRRQGRWQERGYDLTLQIEKGHILHCEQDGDVLPQEALDAAVGKPYCPQTLCDAWPMLPEDARQGLLECLF